MTTPNPPAINARVNDPIIRLLARNFMLWTQPRSGLRSDSAYRAIVRTKPTEGYCPNRRKTAPGAAAASARRPEFVARPGKMAGNGLGGEADFSYWQCYCWLNGPIAQLDRVT